MLRGGEVKRDLISQESREAEGASDLELGAFFYLKKILAGTDLWTPYIRRPPINDFRLVVILAGALFYATVTFSFF